MSAARAKRGGAATSPRAKGARGTRWTPARLMAEAEQARLQAHAPYSKFLVGAALLTKGGRVFRGCNVENASFGLSICAERNAVFKAVSEGERDFVAVAVTAGESLGASPCGACRQVLNEFAPGLTVYWREDGGRIAKLPLAKLLARAFVFRKRRGRG